MMDQRELYEIKAEIDAAAKERETAWANFKEHRWGGDHYQQYVKSIRDFKALIDRVLEKAGRP